MKAREEMPLLRCALGPTGRPFGDGLHSVTASGTDGRKAVITRSWDMAGSTLKKPIRGRKMGVGAKEAVQMFLEKQEQRNLSEYTLRDYRNVLSLFVDEYAEARISMVKPMDCKKFVQEKVSPDRVTQTGPELSLVWTG